MAQDTAAADARYKSLVDQRAAKLQVEPDHIFSEFDVVQLANGQIKLKCLCGAMVATANPVCSMKSHHGGKFCKRPKLKAKRPAEGEPAPSDKGSGGGKKQRNTILEALVHVPKQTAPARTATRTAAAPNWSSSS
jgi:hypothetical protein